MKNAIRRTVGVKWTIIAVCVLVVAACRSSFQSDAALMFLFAQHRDEFQTLVKMANEDIHLIRITPSFTTLDDDNEWPRQNIGIPQKRWAEYKRLFSRVRTDGITKPLDSPQRVEFPINEAGMAPAGSSKGLVYSSTPLTPVLPSLDVRPPDRYSDDKGHTRVYRQIEDHWYIYFYFDE